MSCFIIKDETINKLVNFFASCAYSNIEYKPEITIILNNCGYDLTKEKTLEVTDDLRLMLDMKTLNKSAYNICYGIDEKIDLSNPYDTFEYSFGLCENNIYQILKSLECFLYQCMEGDFYKQNDLFNALKQIEDVLKNYILSHLDEYKKAKWE